MGICTIYVGMYGEYLSCMYSQGNFTHYPFPRLFVKNVKSDTTTEEISELFSIYGRVFDVQKHPNRCSVAFVVSAS